MDRQRPPTEALSQYLTRRDLLTRGGLTGATMALVACTPQRRALSPAEGEATRVALGTPAAPPTSRPMDTPSPKAASADLPKPGSEQFLTGEEIILQEAQRLGIGQSPQEQMVYAQHVVQPLPTLPRTSELPQIVASRLNQATQYMNKSEIETFRNTQQNISNMERNKKVKITVGQATLSMDRAKRTASAVNFTADGNGQIQYTVAFDATFFLQEADTLAIAEEFVYIDSQIALMESYNAQIDPRLTGIQREDALQQQIVAHGSEIEALPYAARAEARIIAVGKGIPHNRQSPVQQDAVIFISTGNNSTDSRWVERVIEREN